MLIAIEVPNDKTDGLKAKSVANGKFVAALIPVLESLKLNPALPSRAAAASNPKLILTDEVSYKFLLAC
jgi:hypothetical protein